MHLGKLTRGELIASVSGIVLALSLFLPWYATDSSDRFSTINGRSNVSLSAWDTQSVLRILLLLAAIAPLILDWIVLRDHALSWPRGELTAVVSITAFVLILIAGFVAKAGQPTDTISLEIGWFVALVASMGMLVGSVQRTALTGIRRKPPGTI